MRGIDEHHIKPPVPHKFPDAVIPPRVDKIQDPRLGKGNTTDSLNTWQFLLTGRIRKHRHLMVPGQTTRHSREAVTHHITDRERNDEYTHGL